MIDFIEGEIVTKELQGIVLKTGGVGFGVKVSNQTLANLPPPGNTAVVFTSLLVREDDISLYGFSSKDERAFFELLIQVSGVGPKLALSVLSTYSIPSLKKALVIGDLAALTAISGVGKKTAQRMILELKDKLDKEMAFSDGDGGYDPVTGGISGEEASQATEALEALGYSRTEIIRAFTGKDLGNMDVEAMIKLGLKLLARY